MSWAPWEVLHNWSPFQIDALGLVTLLGAEEVNSAVGRLVASSYLEYLPLLGAFVIAGNRFQDKAAGFNLYNISHGIHTTDLAGWLTRWMLSQSFESTRSFVQWTVTPPKSQWAGNVSALLISFVFNGFLLAMTVLSRDWYGFTNALSMIISVMVRTYIIGQNRLAIDDMVNKVVDAAQLDETSYEAKRRAYRNAKELRKAERFKHLHPSSTLEKDPSTPAESIHQNTPPSSATQAPPAKVTESQVINTHLGSHHPTPPKPKPKDFPSDVWPSKDPERLNKSLSKVLIIQSDSKAVTFWMPNALLRPPSVFIHGPILLHPRRYLLVRSIGWLVFAVHIVAIGMADLASQLYTVVLLVLPTLLLVLKHGCDDSKWKHTMDRLRMRLYRWGPSDVTPSIDPESGDRNEFKSQRVCYIGSRLKAEIFEWPESYEFLEKGDQEHENKVEWTNCPIQPGEARERSSKRQELYAWLALTSDEEESMDKWDLFPHIRDNNAGWWKEYKSKKWALTSNPAFGPQRAPKEFGSPVARTTATQGADEDDPASRTLRRRGKTGTEQFGDLTLRNPHDDPSMRKSSVIFSAAFPATNDHLTTMQAASDAAQQASATQPGNGVAETIIPFNPSRPTSRDGKAPVSADAISEE